MYVAYFDSSALVKLVLDEQGSDLAASLWDSIDYAVSSRLAYVEVRAALAAARRDRRVSPSVFADAKRSWQRLWLRIELVEATGDRISEAAELAEQYALRGYDALHLASAIQFAEDLPIIASWDDRLRSAARKIGFALAPA